MEEEPKNLAVQWLKMFLDRCSFLPMKEFFDNVLRYPRYLIALILGIFFALFEWVRPLVKNRVSAIALLGIIVGIFLFLTFTLRAMLGLNT